MTELVETAAESAGPSSGERVFHRLLVNTLVSGVTSSFLWFALTFWAYLETRSVIATGVIGAGYGLSAALLGPVFGTYVDRHRKVPAMVLSTSITTVCFGTATLIFLLVDADHLLHLGRPTATGFQVLEVWESREQFDRYDKEVVGPLMAELSGGAPPPAGAEPVEFEVRGLILQGADVRV